MDGKQFQAMGGPAAITPEAQLNVMELPKLVHAARVALAYLDAPEAGDEYFRREHARVSLTEALTAVTGHV